MRQLLVHTDVTKASRCVTRSPMSRHIIDARYVTPIHLHVTGLSAGIRPYHANRTLRTNDGDHVSARARFRLRYFRYHGLVTCWRSHWSGGYVVKF